jgi:hypothetical protein
MAAGDQNDTAPRKPWLTLHVEVAEAGGDCVVQYAGPNLDAVLNALAQAQRHLEAQWRYEKASQMNAQALQAQRDRQVAERLLRKH